MYQNKILEKDIRMLGFQALESVAVSLILTRLKQSKYPITLIEKIEQYNQEKAEENIKKEFPDEGMTGLDPRYAFHVLSVVCAKDLTTIEADDLLSELEYLIKQDYRLTPNEIEQYLYSVHLAKGYYENRWVQYIKQIICITQQEKLNLLIRKYISKHKTEHNKLHTLIGIDESNFDEFRTIWESLVSKHEHILFNELPENYQEAILDLLLWNRRDKLEEWFIKEINPVLEKRFIITERLQKRVLGIINLYLDQLF